MITISHRPGAVAVRAGVSPFGEAETVIFGVDAETGVVVELCMDAETAAQLGAQLAASKVQTATVTTTSEPRS